MKNLKLSLLLLFSVTISSMSFGQFVCSNWNDSPQIEDGQSAHSVYRQALKMEDWQIAFENWETAYNIAPAADGLRDYHLMDGVKLYQHKLKEATTDEEKKTYKAKIDELYDQCIECYVQKAITMNDCDDDCYDQKVGFLYGRLGYEMFYTLNAPYAKNLEVLQKCISKNDVTAEYIVLEPAATIAVYQFKQGKLTAEETRAIHDKLVAIADYNIENENYAEYYDTSKKRALAKFREVEKDIFDCEYFKKALLPKYKANPTDFEVLKYVYNKLKNQGCDPADADLLMIKAEYEKLASSYNASMRAEYEANNPHIAAKRKYDEGNYSEAIRLYQQAIDGSVDNEKKANWYFRLASIQGRKLKKYAAARTAARKAAELKPNWGRPYMLIGDLYAMSSRSCGDSWNQRLAVLAAIDKYAHAKSVDANVSSEASSRMAKYQSSKPDSETAFMQGFKKGQKVKVGCWIGENVSLRFR